MEAEVIVHSDFSASDRDYDSQLHTLESEETETEDQEPEELPSGEPAPPGSPSTQQNAHQVLEDCMGRSGGEAQDELGSDRQSNQAEAISIRGLTNGFHRHRESLNSVESGDLDSVQDGRTDARPVKCQLLSLALEEVPLCSNSGLTSSSSASENVVCVHKH